MAEQIQEEKTARQIDRLSEALDSGVKNRVRRLVRGLSAAEIGGLLESLPLAKRLAFSNRFRWPSVWRFGNSSILKLTERFLST